ncbi:MAG TPA: DUF2207 domain-containing protein [Gemmatimonadaceae bacterium]|nr:DUF2207 domain-containing protein [Gemmatimonadaceae bacterium]
MTLRAARLRALLTLIALLLIPSALLFAQDTGWTITSFNSSYTVRPDRTIDVVETILVDFGPLQKHGIYREIPVRYRKVVGPGLPIGAGTMKVDLDVLSVTDASGHRLPIKVTRGSRVRIRIGDADELVTGKQSYIIHYRLASGLGFFQDHDELYWQVTGTEWPVPILHAAANVTIATPAAAIASDTTGWSAWCYAGWAESSSNERCAAAITGSAEYHFESGRLDPGEGLTLVAAFPKGIVPAPTAADKAASAAATWWPVALPPIVLLFMASFWWRNGREPSVGSIVPMWRPPEGLPPGAAGALADQKADMDDVVATLLDMAVRGYVTIHEVQLGGPLGIASGDSFVAKTLRSIGIGDTDWELRRTDKPANGELVSYEASVLNGVFEGMPCRRMSDLHNEFYKHLPDIKKKMYGFLVEKGLFPKNPESVRNRYILVGVLFDVLGFWLAIGLQNVIVGIGLVVTGLIFFGFANAMPKKTLAGARAWRDLEGLKEYIRRAEKSQLEFSQGPERTTQLFETLLPYAVALDVSDIWVKQFATILASSPPTWYTGNTPGRFDVHHFQSGISDFRSAAAKTMGSAPGSSSGSGGGGSVGGGGGGGGGGSW